MDARSAAKPREESITEGDLAQVVAAKYAQHAADCPTLVRILFFALLSKNLSKFILTEQNQNAVEKMLAGSMVNAADLVCNRSSTKSQEQISQKQEAVAEDLRQHQYQTSMLLEIIYKN